MSVYLDNAATTPMATEVLEAMMPFMTEHFGNPSSSHAFGRKAKTAIEKARRAVANALHVTPGEICFTSGGTEADNMAIRSAVMDLGCSHIITSAVEHSAVIKASEKLESEGLAKLSLVNLDAKGHVDLNHLETLLKSSPKSLVTLMHGNNEIANILPLKEVGELCDRYGAIFHSDTVQTMGHYAFDLREIKVHFITGAGHKFHGPKGIGFLYVNKELSINPLIVGGGQERQMRGGTENLYGIVGLAKAIELAYEDLSGHQQHISSLKQYMAGRLENEVPGVIFNGDSRSADSLYTVLNVTLPENENTSMLLFLLDLEGVACSGGSACSSGAATSSHVLTAINAIRDNRASVRFSFSRYTSKKDIDYCMDKILALCAAPLKATGK